VHTIRELNDYDKANGTLHAKTLVELRNLTKSIPARNRAGIGNHDPFASLKSIETHSRRVGHEPDQ